MITKDIASLPVAELRKRAKAAGITGYSKLKKAALVKALGGGSTKLKAAASHVPGRVSLPSSPAPVVVPQESDEGPEVVAPQAFDLHFDLPATYLKPRAVLLARNPEWLFCYWDFDGETLERLIAGGQTPLLRVLQDGREVYRTTVDLRARRYYIQTPAGGGMIQAQLGRDALGEFLPILTTGAMEAPRARVADDTTVHFVAPAWTGATPEQIRGRQFLTEAEYCALFGEVQNDVPWYQADAR